MLNQKSKPDEVKLTTAEKKTKKRMSYRKPRLEFLGDLRSLTLGGTAGFGDSGGGMYITHEPH